MTLWTRSGALLVAALAFFPGTLAAESERVSLRARVSSLRNSVGVVQFSLYNREGSIPDEKFKKYFRQIKGGIDKGSSSVIFKDLPKGKYALSIHHDENKNGKIDKGLILPIEGVGFSNYKSIGLTHRPHFKGASFLVKKDSRKEVQVIYF